MKKVFSGGDKLEKTLRLLAVKAKNSGVLNVGFPEGSTESDGTSTPLVAYINEFGKEGQPPRPFFRRMIAKESPHWGKDLGKFLKKHNFDAISALKDMGEEIHGELVESIQELVDPPLAPSTIARKGFDKPLIETGRMWQNITSEVKEKE